MIAAYDASQAAGASTTSLSEQLNHGDCQRAADPDEWFPPEPTPMSTDARTDYEQTARLLCGGCPVRAACLELALRYEQNQPAAGIWGGLAPWEREQITIARRAAAASASEAAAPTRRAQAGPGTGIADAHRTSGVAL